jgi:tRNA(Ile)-lysidine synthase
MADSRRSPPADAQAPVDALRGGVAQALAGLHVPNPRALVALSGGRDSVALLHATCAVAPSLGVVVHAVHVHHGLSACADDWAAACESLCASLCVPLLVTRVCVPRHPRASCSSTVSAWSSAW